MLNEEETIEVDILDNDTLSVDIETGGGGSTSSAWGSITGNIQNQTDLMSKLAEKQDTLISGENIKTINNQSILGPGNISIGGGGGSTYTAGENIQISEDNVISATDTIYDDTEIKSDISDLQTNKADVSDIPDVSAFITKNVNDLTYYTLATGTGSTIELTINQSTYVMTLNLKNSAGTTISTGSIDLPLETMVVGGSYDSQNKKIILTLKNGQTVEFSVADLVSGLQSEITSSNKLSSDLVDDTNKTNKFVTANEKSNWNAKASNDIVIIGDETEATEDTKLLVDTSGPTDTLKYKDGNSFKELQIKALDSLPVGVSVEYAGDTIPSEMEGTWMFERGQELNRTEYADLFSRIGTKYGAGNGTTTFNLPNRCGKVAVGLDSNDSDFDELGKTGGSKYLQNHIHSQVKWYNQAISYDNGTGAHFQGSLGINNGNGTTSVNMKTGGVSDVTTGNSGNLQPYIVKNYIIKVKETTPITSETVNTFSNSTKNAYSCDHVNKLLEKGTANINTVSSNNQTSTGTSSTTLENSSSTITTKGGKVLIIANANCYNTGAGFFFTVEIKIDESRYAILQSNQTTSSDIAGSKIIDLPAGTHDVSMFIHGTNESSSLRVPSYTGYGYSIVEL